MFENMKMSCHYMFTFNIVGNTISMHFCIVDMFSVWRLNVLAFEKHFLEDDDILVPRKQHSDNISTRVETI